MKNTIKFFIILISALLLSLFLNRNKWHIIESPVSTKLSLKDPSYCITDKEGNFYTIDNSRRRIMKFSSEKVMDFIISGGSRKQGMFFYANNLAVDNTNNLYVLNEITDSGGFYVVREEILKYDSNGRFTEVFHFRDYEKKTSTLVQRGRFKKLKFSNDRISWFEVKENSILHCSCPADSPEKITKTEFPYSEAAIFISDIAALDNTSWIAVTKKGDIEKLNIKSEKIISLYQASRYSLDSFSVPWNIDVDESGRIFFSDIGDNSIKTLNGNAKTVFSDLNLQKAGYESEGMTYYSFSISGNNISTCNDYSAITCHTDGSNATSISEIRLSPFFIAMKILMFVCLILLTISIVILIMFIYKNIFHRHIPQIIFNIILISVIISLTTLLIAMVLLKNFSGRYINTVTDRTSQMVQIIPRNMNGGLFKKIKTQSDYMNDDFREIRNYMHQSLNDNRDTWNDRYYFVLYRVFNDSLYGMMYLNDGITPFHPFSYFEDTEGAYRKAYKGEIASETDSDNWGTWIYSVGPVYDSEGSVVALLEIGTDLYSYNVENNRLFRNLILEVLMLIIVLLFIIVEMIFFNDLINKKNTVGQDQSSYVKSFILRPINFLFTLGISMSVAFVPVMMKGLYQPLFGLSEEMIIAIPISLEMLFFVTGILIAGELSYKGKLHLILFPGTVLSATGLLMSGISSDMFMFFAARSVTGLGSGLILIGLRTVISNEVITENKSQAYSHFYSGAMAGLNVGVFFGAFLADQIGFSKVFYIAFFIIIISGIFMKLFLKGLNYIHPPIKRQSFIFLRFMLHPKILLYFIMIIIPTYTAGMFLVYYFPLFADSRGISVADIGKFFILNGILIVYLGPFLSKYIIKFVGVKRSVILGSFGWALSLAIFAMTGNVVGAIITIILMSMTEGFCVTAQNDYYLGLDVVKQTGEEKSIAYFEVAAKFSEIIAPLIFGSLLFFGPRKGLLYISIGIIALTITYVIFIKNVIANPSGTSK